MTRFTQRFVLDLLETGSLWAVLFILILNAYASFFIAPYYGFIIESNGEIREVFGDSALQVGDRLRQAGDLSWADFSNHLRQPLFSSIQPGLAVLLVVERDGREQTIQYVFPEPGWPEFEVRVYNIWPVPFIFWAVGLAALQWVWPKDLTRRLFIAFNLITALWISCGTLSSRHVWESAIWLRSWIWLAVPVYVHLHYVFPRPLSRIPPLLAGLGYGLAVALAAAQWLEWLSGDLFYIGFLLAIGLSLILLAAHAIFQKDQRAALAILLRAVLLACLPLLALLIYGLIVGRGGPAGGGLMFLPILPIAYFYAFYRYRLGGQELRVNTAIAAFLFVGGLSFLTLLLISWLTIWLDDPASWILVGLALTVAAALITLLGFSGFQAFVERRFLGIRHTATGLLTNYAAQVSAMHKMDDLVAYLRDEVAPSQLIRQSALTRIEGGRLAALYQHGLETADLSIDLEWLHQNAGRYLPPTEGAERAAPDWVRLALPLIIESQLAGYWLLGRRDPDDFYSARDRAALNTISHQTGMALTNITQAGRLHTLYQTDIDQREAERANIARELHDQVLNELGLLWRTASQNPETAALEASYQRLTDSLRRTITGLRPAAVDFGLRLALTDLVDRAAQDGARIPIELRLAEGAEGGNDYQRHPPAVELHLYRIVQQALANALLYARASSISIEGRIDQDQIDLSVSDDGTGFAAEIDPDISQLIAQGHYGIANMSERAALIGARLSIRSAPGQGACIRVQWTAPA